MSAALLWPDGFECSTHPENDDDPKPQQDGVRGSRFLAPVMNSGQRSAGGDQQMLGGIRIVNPARFL
jgi:hypothetical protein